MPPVRAGWYEGRPGRAGPRKGRVRATFLADGFVRGAWRIEKTRDAATLVIEPFEPLPVEARDALFEEGERLVRFVEDGAETFEVRFVQRA